MSDNQDTRHVGRTYSGVESSYLVRDIIGAGGMGLVCLGEDVESGRQVAVKFLHAELHEEHGSSRERFKREIRVLQDLRAFRGIVRIEDYGETDEGLLFLVMEFVDAPTLDKVIEASDQGMPQIEAIQVAIEILLVLEPIHRARFVHRDLKPQNICIHQEPLNVRLLDFGLSKPFSGGGGYAKVTRRIEGKGGEIPGSPHYMATEQFLDPKAVDARTDLYAVGVILYEMLAGLPPFRGIYLQEILKQHRSSEAPTIENCADGGPISYRLQAVLDKALGKEQKSRYQSAEAFKEDLYEVLGVLNKARRPKKRLDEHYRVARRIGTGGNSEVYEAEFVETGDRVALKVAKEDSESWNVETLVNEADRALVHENIVRIQEFGAFEGRPALVMELMEEGNVEDLLEKYADTGFPEALFYRTIVDICRGLHHAHLRNIVHRDVKPANMLCGPDGVTKICDFGIAKRFEATGGEVTGSANTVMAKGTPQYIAPEQCDLQGRVDRRADIYSLGIVMYEMLAGRLPFTEGILIMHHVQSDPPPLEVRGNFRNPDRLCRIVERCMQKDKEERFQSMKELAQEIVRTSKLASQSTTHVAIPLHTVPQDKEADAIDTTSVPVTGTVPTPRRSRVPMALGGLAAVMIAIAAYVIFNRDDPPSPITSDPTTARVEVDEAARARRLERDELDRLREADDWEALAAFELEHLGSESAEVGEVANSVVLDLRSAMEKAGSSSESSDVVDEIAVMTGALRRLAPNHAAVPALRSLTEKAKWLAEPFPTTSSDFVAWRDSEHKVVVAAADDAAASLGHSALAMGWKLRLRRDRRRRVERNGQVIATLANQASPADPLSASWFEALREFDAQRRTLEDVDPTDVYGAVRNRLVQRALAADDLAGVVATVRSFATSLGIDRANWPAIRREASLRRERSDRRARGLTDVVAAGLVAMETKDVFGVRVAAALGRDPLRWQEDIDPAVDVGFLMRRASASFRDAAIATIGRAGFADLPTVGAPLDAERMTSLDASFDRFATTAFVAADERVVRDAWEKRFAPFRPRETPKVWQEITTDYGQWAQSIPRDLNVTVLDGLLRRIAAHVRGRTEGEEFDQASEFIREMITSVQAGRRWTTLLLLTHRPYRTLLPDPERLSDRAVAELSTAFLQGNVDYRPDGGALDVAWLGSSDKIIQLEVGLPPGEAELFRSQVVAIDATAGDVTMHESHMTVELAPQEVFEGVLSTSSAARMIFDVRLELSSKSLNVEAIPVVLTHVVDDRVRRDFSVPTVTVTATTTPVRAGKVEFAVRVDDDRALSSDVSAPILVRLAGRTLPASRNVSRGENSEAIYRADLSRLVADLATLSITVRDAVGNEAVADVAKFSDHVRSLASRAGAARRTLDAVAGRSIEVLTLAPLSDGRFRALSTWMNEVGTAYSTVLPFDPAASRERTAGVVNAIAMWLPEAVKIAPAPSPAKLDAFLTQFVAFERHHGGGNRAVGLRRQMASLARTTTTPTNTGNSNSGNPTGRNPNGSSSTGNNGRRAAGTGTTRPPRSRWSDRNVNALGIQFVRIGPSTRPAWIATVEMSAAFAKRHLAALNLAEQARKESSRYKQTRWAISGDKPLVPMTPNMAVRAVTALNRNTSTLSGLESQCGGTVKFDIPTYSQWKSAARKAAGPRAKYPWGAESNAKPYSISVGTRFQSWYLRLRGVASDGSQSPFHFLSGNAEDIVRVGSSFGYKGGLHASSSSRARRECLVDERAKSLRPNDSSKLSGVRLAIVPR